MKRILLSLAVIALASCVKESPLTPVQPGADQVSIKAVAAESKTLLDGINVVWEKTDEIAVVLNGETKVASNFSVVESSMNGSSTDFVGTLNPEWDNFTSAYAVYPASAVDMTNNTITHTLPENQVGGVTSGMLLSSSLLSLEDLQNGEAEAEFHNALTLLNVAVPAGVKSVELKSANDGLVGTTSFNINNGLLTRSNLNSVRTVSLVAETELEARTYPVLVYPGHVGDLTLKMVGTDETVFEKTLSDIWFNAGTVRKVDLTQIFKIYAEETIYASPLGGVLGIPVVMTADYEFTVTENASWLSVSASTKAFHGTTICLDVQQNNTAAVRTAQVTVSWGDESRNFIVSQNGLYLGFVKNSKGEQIQWEEEFGIFSSEESAIEGVSPVLTYKNVFTIELSDDFSKGTYKIHNMFLTDAYWDENLQRVSGIGGEYYADYNDGKLTINMRNSKRSYFFTQDVVLTYDETAMKFTSALPLEFNVNTASSYSKTGFIGGYVASVKADAAAGENTLFGDYAEAFDDSGYYGNPSKGTLKVAKSDDDRYDLKMTFFGGTSSAVTVYATVEGNTITTVKPNGYTNMGSFYASTLTVADGVISGTLNFDYPVITDYTATKK